MVVRGPLAALLLLPFAARGFVVRPATARPRHRTLPPRHALSEERVDVDLGGGRSVAVLLPKLADEETALELADARALGERFDHLYGAGDIVWPSAIALARLVTHCPSFVQGRTVVELGCGLGLAGQAAAMAGAARVVLTDADEDALSRARQAAELNGLGGDIISTARLDWNGGAAAARDALESAAGGAPVDVVLGADILYDEARSSALTRARLRA